MKNKTYSFADLGEKRTTTTEADFRTGMIRNTIAMAEDVNTYGNMIDEQVEVISKEIVNALEGQGISVDPNLNNQLSTMLKTKMPGGYSLTGVYFDGVNQPTATLTNSSTITFSAFTAYFNTKGYFGNTQADLTKVTMPQTTVTIDSDWGTGVHFLFLNSSGAISHQQERIDPKQQSTVCMLGSVFVIDNNGTIEFQSDSFKYQPWLCATDHRTREVPVAETKGGYISAATATELEMGTLDIVDEGINFLEEPTQPSIMRAPRSGMKYLYKMIHPDYDPNEAATTTLDTTHIYNLTDEVWEQVDPSAIGKFMIMVPCIVPTGQTLIVAPMSPMVDGAYTQVYDTQEEAELAIFGLQYTSSDTDHTRERCIYLGQSLIVRIGPDVDLTDNENFKSVEGVPQALAGYTSSYGQAGGSAGQFIPMPEVLKAGDEVMLNNFSSNIIQGSSTTTAVEVHLPQPTNGRMNEIMAKYTHVKASGSETLSDGLDFDSNVRWWVQPPVFVEGNTYLFTFDYINGYWYGDYNVYSNL